MMGLLTHLILSFVHLLLVAIDLLFFFTLVRLLCYRWQSRWLTAVNSAGRPLVDWFSGYVQKGLNHFAHGNFSEKAVLLVGMSTLTLARFVLVALFSK